MNTMQNQQGNPYNIQYDIHPDYFGYQESVIRTTIDLIHRGAHVTPMRQWFYNVVSQCGWYNQQFKETIEIIFKFLVVTDIGNPSDKFNADFIFKCCDGGIKLAMAFIIQQFPNEYNNLRDFQESNRRNLEILQGVVRDYAMYTQGGMPMQSQNMYGGYPSNGVPVQGGYIPQPQNMHGGYPNNPQPMYTAHQQYQYPNTTPSLSNPQRQPTMNTGYTNPPSNHQVISRFGNIELPDTTANLQNTVSHPRDYLNKGYQNVDPEPLPVVEEEEILTEKDWKSTPQQPYKTLCTSKQKAIYRRINGVVTEIIVERPEMERDPHAGRFKACGVVFPARDQTKFIEDVKAYCEITAEDIAERFANKPRKDILESVKESVSEENLQVPFLEAAITYGQIEQQNREEIEGANVFKMYATVAKPIVTDSAEDNTTIQEINECNDIPEIVKLLRDKCTRSANENTDIQNVVYCTEIDKSLANAINNFVIHSLSINTKIDSFVEDIYDLLEILKTDHGKLYTEAMMRFRQQIFKKGPFISMTKDEIDPIRNSLFSGVETDNPDTTISLIPTQYSLTFVSTCSDELDMYYRKDSKLISELSLPTLYGLAKSSFEHADGLPNTVLRHLLITRDGRVFEFHKGYLTDDAYLIREFSEKVDLV